MPETKMPGHSGMFAKKDFQKGDVVCNYPGNVIKADYAEKLADGYTSKTCYMFFFKKSGDIKRWYKSILCLAAHCHISIIKPVFSKIFCQSVTVVLQTLQTMQLPFLYAYHKIPNQLTELCHCQHIANIQTQCTVIILVFQHRWNSNETFWKPC